MARGADCYHRRGFFGQFDGRIVCVYHRIPCKDVLPVAGYIAGILIYRIDRTDAGNGIGLRIRRARLVRIIRIGRIHRIFWVVRTVRSVADKPHIADIDAFAGLGQARSHLHFGFQFLFRRFHIPKFIGKGRHGTLYGRNVFRIDTGTVRKNRDLGTIGRIKDLRITGSIIVVITGSVAAVGIDQLHAAAVLVDRQLVGIFLHDVTGMIHIGTAGHFGAAACKTVFYLAIGFVVPDGAIRQIQRCVGIFKALFTVFVQNDTGQFGRIRRQPQVDFGRIRFRIRAGAVILIQQAQVAFDGDIVAAGSCCIAFVVCIDVHADRSRFTHQCVLVGIAVFSNNDFTAARYRNGRTAVSLDTGSLDGQIHIAVHGHVGFSKSRINAVCVIMCQITCRIQRRCNTVTAIGAFHGDIPVYNDFATLQDIHAHDVPVTGDMDVQIAFDIQFICRTPPHGSDGNSGSQGSRTSAAVHGDIHRLCFQRNGMAARYFYSGRNRAIPLRVRCKGQFALLGNGLEIGLSIYGSTTMPFSDSYVHAFAEVISAITEISVILCSCYTGQRIRKIKVRLHNFRTGAGKTAFASLIIEADVAYVHSRGRAGQSGSNPDFAGQVPFTGSISAVG